MIAIVGLAVLYGIAYLFSRDRSAIRYRTLGWGLALQLVFALIVMKTPPGRAVFRILAAGVTRLFKFADMGADFVFGPLAHDDLSGFVFAFQVLPVVIFIASFFSVLYYIGLMQRIVMLMAKGMRLTMGVSGSESLAAAANVFMGQTEAPIVIAPYVPSMTRSEIMALMTGGFATVSGAVLAAYVGLGVQAEYLIAASVMAAPASLVMAKLFFPETEVSKTAGEMSIEVEREEVNVLDAAARGASKGVTLALNIGGMLIAFLALVALTNGLLAVVGAAFADRTSMAQLSGGLVALLIGYVALWKPSRERALKAAAGVALAIVLAWVVFLVNGPGELPLRLEIMLGVLFAPIAWLMGVPWSEAGLVGELFGTKLVLTEFVAYIRMVEMRDAGLLSPKSEIIASYALCGFANLASVAIQIGGIGALAPTRKADLARIGLWAMVAGMMASYTVAALAGLLVG